MKILAPVAASKMTPASPLLFWTLLPTSSLRHADVRKMPFNLPKFGGVFDDGFHVVSVMGTVAFLRHDYYERSLAAMLTPSGAEEFPTYEMKEIKPGMTVYSVSIPPPALPELWNPFR